MNVTGKKRIFLNLIGLLCIVALAGWLVPTKTEADTKTLTSISAYYYGGTLKVGDPINTSNLYVTAFYNDGTSERVYGYTLSTYVIGQGGTNTIYVYFGNMSTSFSLYSDYYYYNVYFETYGGTYVSPIYNVKMYDTITLPSAPTKFGYRFKGWFTSGDYSQQFTESTKISQTTTLYAKWEAKAILNGNTLSYTVNNGTLSSTISANLSGQTYGPNVDMDVTGIDASKVTEAVKKIAITDHFFAFEFNMMDYTYNDSNPLPITLTIPSGFDGSKCAVYYTTNRKTILGKMKGQLISPSTYMFYAYDVGSYLLIEGQDKVVNTPDTSADNAYITIEQLDDPLTVNGQAALIVDFHNYAGVESSVALNWSSSDPFVADVDQNGNVTAYEKGTTTITVASTDGKLKATYKLKVVPDSTLVQKIKTNITKKTLRVGQKFQLVAEALPETAFIKRLTYSSSNSKIASISSTGKITAKRKGTCYIYVETTDASEFWKEIKITVK